MRYFIIAISLILAELCFAAIAHAQGPLPIPMQGRGGTSGGLVQPGLVANWDLRTRNLARYSEDGSNSAWTKTNATATATVLTATNSSASMLQTLAAVNSTAYTFSIQLKRKTGAGTVSVQIIAGTTQACTITADAFSACSVTYTSGTSETLSYGVLLATSGDEVYYQYAQLNEGPTALPYVPTTDLQRVAVGQSTWGSVPVRREIGGQVVYDPAPSYLSRYTYSNGETRQIRGTNLLTWSEDLGSAGWSARGAATITTNAAIAPDGSMTADLVSWLGSAGVSDLYQTISAPVSISESVSVYIKRVSTSGVLRITDPIGSSGSDGSYSVNLALLSDGWEHITASHPAVSVNSSFKSSNSGTSGLYLYTSNGPLSFYLWGTQLNPGTLPDEYTKTEAVPLEPGYPFLTLGASTAAGSDDPTRRLAGMTFTTDDFLKTASAVSLSATHSLLMVANSSDNSTFMEQSASLSSNPGSYIYGGGSAACAIKRTGSQITYGSVNWQGGGWVDLGCIFSTAVNGYKNGALHGIGSTITDSGVVSDVVYIGSRGGTSLFTNGTISFVTLYNRALNPKEIRQNHERYYKPSMSAVGVTLP